MKKGKKREITLEQLQKRKEIANKITIRLLTLVLIVALGKMFGAIKFTIIEGYTYKFILIFLITILFLVIVFYISDIIEKNIKRQIKEKQAQEKISKIKKMAE